MACTDSSAPRDNTPPTVVETSPSNGSNLGHVNDVVIGVTFSESMDAATINSTNLTLRLTSSGAYVAATVSYDPATHKATVSPATSLLKGTSYTVTCDKAVTDMAGNLLGTNYQFVFDTGDGVAPTIVATTPSNGATGVTIGSTIKATFSEPMDGSSLRPAAFTLSSSTGLVPDVTSSYDEATNTVTFTPTRALSEKSTYKVTINGIGQDVSGVPFTGSFQWSFTTVDNTPPEVTGASPPRGNANIELNAVAQVFFSESMDASTVNSETFLLLEHWTGKKIAGAISLNANRTSATLTPSAPLSPGTAYDINVTNGPKDDAGNPLQRAFESNFYTTATPDVLAPYVVSNSPADGETGVRANGVIGVVFDDWIEYNSINTSSFLVRNAVSGQSVEGSVAQDGSPQYWKFTPRFELDKNTRYIVTLTVAIRDDAGNAMKENYSFSFTTAP
ncbi:MAG: Ig-like domain-containing protein [Gemmatimonadaceae bacterium]